MALTTYSQDIIYNSYAGVDIVAEIVLPGESPLILGELQTISYSMHRENAPVRSVGHVNPIGFVKGPRCLPASEKVLLKDRGYISIADVRAGDYVQSSATTYDKVLGSFSQGLKKCFQLKLSNGYNLIASYDHPISTERGWVEMQDLKPGVDKVHVVGQMPISEEEYLIEDDLLKMVALFIGDGAAHIYPKKYSDSKEHRLSLSINDEEMDTIGVETERILNTLGISFRDTRKGDDKCISRTISVCFEGYGQTDWRLRRYNTIHKIFLELGLYDKYSHTKFIPQDFIVHLSKRQVILFLRYLFSTDGGYSINNEKGNFEAFYGSTSEELIDSVRVLLAKLGILALKNKQSKVGKRGGRPDIVSRYDYFILTISDSLDLMKFVCRVGIFGKDTKIEEFISMLTSRMCRGKSLDITAKDFLKQVQAAIDRKYLKKGDFKLHHNIYNYNRKISPRYALKLANALGDSEIFQLVDSLLEKYFTTNYDLIPRNVISVIPIGELPVYDLEVENRHAFVSNFIRVHNTLAGSMIFTVFNEYAFYRLDAYKQAISFGLFPLADMLPPFDVVITFVNEYGSISKMRIYGVTIVDEGQTMSVDDLVTEQLFSYMARGIYPMISKETDDARQESLPIQIVFSDTNFSITGLKQQ